MLTFDIRAVQLDSRQELFDLVGGMQITGAVKLGQRYLVELLTEKGTLAYLPDRGTTFLTALRLEHYSELDVIAAFSEAKIDLQRNLVLEENEDDPNVERYSDSEIDEIVIANGAIKMTIRVFTLSGGEMLVELPVIVFTEV